MDINEISYRLYETLRQARVAKHVRQDELAYELGVPQPRVAEMENRLRKGNLTKQTALLFQTAAAVGLVPMFVPAEAVNRVAAAIEDTQDVRSTWDEVFVDLGAEDKDEAAWNP